MAADSWLYCVMAADSWLYCSVSGVNSDKAAGGSVTLWLTATGDTTQYSRM